MTLYLLSAYATNSDVKYSDYLRRVVRRATPPSQEEAKALLAPLAQSSVRGARDGQDWPMELSQVEVGEQAQLGITGSHPLLSVRLAVHLCVLEPVLIPDDDPAALTGVELLYLAPVAETPGRERNRAFIRFDHL